jgi:hypothetical protein
MGVAVTLFVGWFMSERFARKPTKKEIHKYEQTSLMQEKAWAEGFDSVELYQRWLEGGRADK